LTSLEELRDWLEGRAGADGSCKLATGIRMDLEDMGNIRKE
jgi:hypothetical protein